MPLNPDSNAKLQLDEYVSCLRDAVKFIRLSEQEYATANRLLAEKMTRIYDMTDTFIRSLPIDDKPVVEDATTLLVAIIRDGLARLAADAREGMDYEQFLKQLEEERAIWSSQLIVGHNT